MSASTKMSTAVKALCFLAGAPDQPKTSGEIASNIGVNASKLRKLLSMLVKSGIVESTQGTTGGFIIAKDLKKIHLQEIYCALEDRKAFHLDVTNSNGKQGAESAKVNQFFLDLFSEIQIDIENKMRDISLSDIVESSR
ncbi:MAG: Rrf2 family transcriptional regulator [Calditrichaceae bacterium]